MSGDDDEKKDIEKYRTKLKQTAEKLPASFNIKHEQRNGEWCIFYGGIRALNDSSCG